MRVLALIAVAFPALSLAQAWLPPQGEGVVTMLYQNHIERLHVYSDGRTRDKGHTFFDAAVLDTDFSLTDRLAIKVSLPFWTSSPRAPRNAPVPPMIV